MINKICGIYKITSPSNKIYIGQSKDINRRINGYKKCFGKTQPKLYYSIMKYGWDDHNFEIIHKCKEFELNYLEKHYIKLYNTFDTKHGMNLTTGGEGHIFSKESRKKMSYNAKIRTYSDITRQKLSNSLTGIKRSKETINKMRKCKTGLTHTEESKQKIRDKKCGTYEIYNQNNKLIHKFHSNVKKEFKKLNLPEHRFCNTYKYNTKIKNGIYEGWYVIKL